ncbi:fluoride efflux transporter CrcB [Frankia sp. AiPa1]|uniref:fluoride efflux transporter CrcB n=1 Tax=Frankia sp. AiPa1 TaxID=573492 RepID=UPI00202B5E7A|nr:fluoride efflux transporter CrcB [Frankia sp. AiPa1]MCL9758835.1 fluoride efflux transporter CrcB [Frankia sp. AiPa1]
MNWLLVIVGAAVGAPLRYLTDRAIQARHDTVFPWGTFTVNIASSLVLGLVTGAVTAGAASPRVALLVGTGFCGTLSTYSTFSYETLRLAEEHCGLLAAANVVGSVLAAFGAAVLGSALARAVWA